MSYNEIEINGSTVQGHRYAGGGVNTYDNNFANNDNPYTFTMPYDGMLNIWCWSQNQNASIGIKINDVSCGVITFGTSNFATYSLSLPLKKNDIIVFTASNFTYAAVRLLAQIYR